MGSGEGVKGPLWFRGIFDQIYLYITFCIFFRLKVPFLSTMNFMNFVSTSLFGSLSLIDSQIINCEKPKFSYQIHGMFVANLNFCERKGLHIPL